MGLTAAVTLLIPETGSKSLADIERGLSSNQIWSSFAKRRFYKSEVPAPPAHNFESRMYMMNP